MNFRLPFFHAVISLLCGVFLFFVFRYFSPGADGDLSSSLLEKDPGKAAFAVLAFDETQDDRRLQALLAQHGIENFVSESSQYVPIDDFGALKMFRLDSFHDEIEEFDPRDDGYAARLRSFFVHGGKRFFFSPLEDLEQNGDLSLKKRFTDIFEDIPYSFEVLGRKRSLLPYFLLLALGAVFTLYFSASRRRFAYQLPLLLASGWAGFPSALVAAGLSALWELLREPFGELSAVRHYNRNAFNYAGTGVRATLERLKPFRVNLFLAFFCAAFIVFFSAAFHILIPAAAALVCFFFLDFLSLKAERTQARENRHLPFVPVLLFPVRARTFSLFPFLLPFGAVSLLALFLPHIYEPRGEAGTLINPGYFVHPEEYYRHVAFERSFSYTPLNADAFSGGEGLKRYYLGGDGLIAGARAPQSGALPDGKDDARTPPFPLEKLMNFLLEYYQEPESDPGATGEFRPLKVSFIETVNIKELISVGVILIVCIADLFRPGVSPRRKASLLGDRRIAA